MARRRLKGGGTAAAESEPGRERRRDPSNYNLVVATEVHHLQCMEIWGGNSRIDSRVSLAGVDCWVYSVPFASCVPAGAASAAERADGRGEGGDIHYVTCCATGRITRLVVADVSGHGAPVAEMATSLRRLMRKHSNHYDQRGFVVEVNRHFSELVDPARGPETTRNAAVFATGLFASFYAPTNELAVCNAGHPRPLRYDAEKRSWSVLSIGPETGGSRSPANLPLGVIEESRYDQSVSTLGPDDLVLVYTDSLIETRGKSGKFLGEAGLLELLSTIDPGAPDDFITTLVRRLCEFAGSSLETHAFEDDFTVLLMRRNERKPAIAPVLALKGAWNLARGVASSARAGLPISIPDMGTRSILGAGIRRFNRPLSGTKR